MTSYDVIVVGSGPGATFASYGLANRKILVLDIGFDAPAGDKLTSNIYELRRQNEDMFLPLIGEQFESLHNLHRPPISLKLKSPYMSYIVRDWQRLSPVVSDSFHGVLSLAKGGLANGWGAGVYRFTDRDLAGFPFDAGALRPFYDELTSYIGVSGANDDLEDYFERDTQLLPPLHLSDFFNTFLTRYQRKRSTLQHDGFAVGRPRLAVLTEPRNGRPEYRYNGLEFFQPHIPALYTPAYTIDEMIMRGAIDYRSSRMVVSYRETNEGVEVYTRNIQTGVEEVWLGRMLCLGAGALNTARIVLESNSDYETKLPVLDNPMTCLPFFDLRRIGAALPSADTSLAQLNLVLEDPDWNVPLQASLYGTTGPLRSDVAFGLPLSIRANLIWTKYVVPASGLLMLFYPGSSRTENYVRLQRSGALDVHFAAEPVHAAEKRIIRFLRKLGYLCHESLIQRPGMGAGLHFAGTLPMHANPGKYQTGPDGRLYGTTSVYVVDGACFSRLPAKNLTFTIMANALRIGRQLANTC